MKLWKSALVTSFVIFSVFTSIVYTACTKDSCASLQCKNGGSCTDGFCHCPTGYEGTECGTKASDKFIGKYYGTTKCDATQAVVDTAIVFLASDSASLGIFRYTDMDTIYGIASGNQILVADEEDANTSRSVTITLDARSISFFTHKVTDVSQEMKNTCYFSGARK